MLLKCRIALLLIGLLSSTVWASQTLDDYKQASASLLQRLEQAKGQPEAPGRSDPQVAHWLDQISDPSVIQGRDPEDISLDLCAGATKILAIYTLWGIERFKPGAPATASNDPSVLKALAVKVATLGDENTRRYAAEVLPIGAFSTRCMAAALPNLWAKLSPAERTPVRMQGLQRMRSGEQSTLLGMLRIVSDSSLPKQLRQVVLDALKDTVSTLSAPLTLAQRSILLTRAQETSRLLSDPAQRDAIAFVVTVLDDKRCEGLCQW
jgi:hypothetical protein